MSSSVVTPVIFRRWKGGEKSVIALFPSLSGGRYSSLCLSYEHIGQHGGADYYYVMKSTKRAEIEDPDVKELYDELVNAGYVLKIVARCEQAHYADRVMDMTVVK